MAWDNGRLKASSAWSHQQSFDGLSVGRDQQIGDAVEGMHAEAVVGMAGVVDGEAEFMRLARDELVGHHELRSMQLRTSARIER